MKALLSNLLEAQSSVLTREANLDDVDTLIELMRQLGYIIDQEEMRRNVQHYTVLPHQKAWVAEKEGKVVGCVAVAATNFFHKPGSFLRVITMVVDQQHRKSGIGKHLMQLADNYAAELGCSHIELTSGMHRAKLGSHDFYRSLGYSELNDQKKYFAKDTTPLPSVS